MRKQDLLRGFSHQPGHSVLIPGTLFYLKVYPASLALFSLTGEEKKRLFWDLEGPLRSFTVEMDLEREGVRIYGEGKQGYFRFFVRMENDSLVLLIEKSPFISLKAGEKIELLSCVGDRKGEGRERLFLGCSKQKEWEKIRLRRDLREILPLWYALGQKSPATPPGEGGVFTLLESSKEICEKLLDLYLAGFFGGFVPRLFDDEYQGIVPPTPAKGDAAALLSCGALLIRSLFFEEKEGVLHLLPRLPSLFTCGRMEGLLTKGGVALEMEWTKGKIRKVQLLGEGKVDLRLPQELCEFRVRRDKEKKGEIVSRDEPLWLEKGQVVYLDRFQK